MTAYALPMQALGAGEARKGGSGMALSETLASTHLLIGGEERPAADTFAVYDPHDGAVAGHAAAASHEQALDAVHAAQTAWPAWAALTAVERAQRAIAALGGLDADAGERAEMLVRENGKILMEAQIDLAVFVGRFHQAAEFAASLDEPERIEGPPFRTTIAHVPAGVVTIIYPFNWPLAILAASLPYALMAGNAVVVKPPPSTPLSSVATLRHVALALPPGSSTSSPATMPWSARSSSGIRACGMCASPAA